MRIKGVTTGLLKRIKESLFDMVTSRLLLLFIIFIAMAAVLIYRIFDLQIVNGESYLNNFQLKIQKEKIIEGTRGNIYDRNGKLLAYNELGIGRLIHQLPASLCEMFLNEVFEDGKADIFEEEELTTVYTFFDNNLNISETARQLYVHRNTLVYRLEKIQKKTGLDVRVFEDALTFKIAMMVADHMKYMKQSSS